MESSAVAKVRGMDQAKELATIDALAGVSLVRAAQLRSDGQSSIPDNQAAQILMGRHGLKRAKR